VATTIYGGTGVDTFNVGTAAVGLDDIGATLSIEALREATNST